MPGYETETQAARDGFRIVHDSDGHRYVLLQRRAAEGAAPEGPEGSGTEEQLVGEAHYTLLGASVIDFDHTVVSPALRGTGLSSLLARHALTGEAVTGRRVQASCWFIAQYLAKHPELVERSDR